MQKIIRIAIADDHQLFRTGIRMILKEKPEFLVVQEATNGMELLEGIPNTKPDVILLDLEMPVLSGREALIEIQKNNPDIKVLMLTIHNNQAFILQMMELGANGYLFKNTDPDEVIKAINKVIESDYYFSDNVSKAMLFGISNKNGASTSLTSEHNLTQREIDVLRLICKEYTTAQIGEALFLSPKNY